MGTVRFRVRKSSNIAREPQDIFCGSATKDAVLSGELVGLCFALHSFRGGDRRKTFHMRSD
jgi:hypothetical protein